MIALDNGDKIRGDTTTAAKVDYTLHGVVSNVITQLADGQLPNAIGDLYTAGVAGVIVASIILVNTNNVAETVNLYLTPNGGVARRLIPKDLSLASGYSLVFDGQKFQVLDTSGQTVTSFTKTLGQLSNVTLAAEADHDMIYYDLASSKWKNATPAAVLAQLSGQAGAAFSFNGQNLTSVGDVQFGANKLKSSSYYIKEFGAGFGIYRTADDLQYFGFDDGYIKIVNTGSIRALTTTNGHVIYLDAYDVDGVAWSHVLAMVNNNDPHSRLEAPMYLNGQIFNAGAGSAEIDTTGVSHGLIIKCTNDGAAGGRLNGRHISASPADNDILFSVDIDGKDDGGADQSYHTIRYVIEDASAGIECGKQDWYHMLNGAWNQVLTLSAAGLLAVDLSGSGVAAQVDLFDEYDDALILQQGIQQSNRDLLVKIGILEKKASGSGYFLKIQPMLKLLAGGIYQTRARIDNLERRLLDNGKIITQSNGA